MRGAEMIGLSHVWLKGNRSEKALPCCAQAKIINSLEEIEIYLESPALA
jgi:hypothetical protein